jgi:hypothetical protein
MLFDEMKHFDGLRSGMAREFERTHDTSQSAYSFDRISGGLMNKL